MPELVDRFSSARRNAPLSDLGPSDRRELDTILGSVEAFEDLPGRWQAALLAAETPGEPPARSCCGGH